MHPMPLLLEPDDRKVMVHLCRQHWQSVMCTACKVIQGCLDLAGTLIVVTIGPDTAKVSKVCPWLVKPNSLSNWAFLEESCLGVSDCQRTYSSNRFIRYTKTGVHLRTHCTASPTNSELARQKASKNSQKQSLNSSIFKHAVTVLER